ncbi:hypothetical protein HZA99_06695 [Candidatus Woesearchaeota archaeon]|nr:hypothetical protein [Candidatus Woesearchaeota archaeon]
MKVKATKEEVPYKMRFEDIEEKKYEEYEKRRRKEEDVSPPIILREKIYIPKEEREEVRERKASVTEIRKAIVRERTRDIQPLQFMGTEIVGDLFDRVEFLKERMEEMNQNIISRQELNGQLVADINFDIQKKYELLNKLSNKEDIRELQLDISLLKMERRKENTLFWRDVVALKKELRDLIEQYKIESKIARIFGDAK